MRPILVSIFIIISIIGLNAQNVAQEAQKAYQEGEFRTAIELLEKEIKTRKEDGEVSAQLYYNLGNAYFRVNDVPEAILNYERAQLYDPGDSDIKHNIAYAQTKIEDKILVADNFFLSIWFQGVQNLMSSNQWAVLSIVVFVLFIASLVVFFFSQRLVFKKAGFYAGVMLFTILVFSNIFAFNQKNKIEHRNTAIIMAGSATVVSSPSSASKELFVLHAGTKVEIRKTDGNWLEIEIANGTIGWIQQSKLEII